MSDNQAPDRASDEARPESPIDERSGTADVTARVELPDSKPDAQSK